MDLEIGRPDISVHCVGKKLEEVVIKMINRFIEMQVLGAIIPEGKEIKMYELPAGMTCRHGGDLEDQ